jgi:hypothetical protein
MNDLGRNTPLPRVAQARFSQRFSTHYRTGPGLPGSLMLVCKYAVHVWFLGDDQRPTVGGDSVADRREGQGIFFSK